MNEVKSADREWFYRVLVEYCIARFTGLIFIKGWGWLSLLKDGSREVWDDIDSSSDGMMWGDWVFGSGVIVDGRPEGVAVVLELVALGSM